MDLGSILLGMCLGSSNKTIVRNGNELPLILRLPFINVKIKEVISHGEYDDFSQFDVITIVGEKDEKFRFLIIQGLSKSFISGEEYNIFYDTVNHGYVGKILRTPVIVFILKAKTKINNDLLEETKEALK